MSNGGCVGIANVAQRPLLLVVDVARNARDDVGPSSMPVHVGGTPSHYDDPDLIGTHTHCLLTEQPACRCPVTVAAIRRGRVLGIRGAVRVIAATWTKVDDKLVSCLGGQCRVSTSHRVAEH